MSDKKKIRKIFNGAVFGRDNFRCKVCGIKPEKLDAHHITDRHEMPKARRKSE